MYDEDKAPFTILLKEPNAETNLALDEIEKILKKYNQISIIETNQSRFE